jgi:hypothetical protein
MDQSSEHDLSQPGDGVSGYTPTVTGSANGSPVRPSYSVVVQSQEVRFALRERKSPFLLTVKTGVANARHSCRGDDNNIGNDNGHHLHYLFAG